MIFGSIGPNPPLGPQLPPRVQGYPYRGWGNLNLKKSSFLNFLLLKTPKLIIALDIHLCFLSKIFKNVDF